MKTFILALSIFSAQAYAEVYYTCEGDEKIAAPQKAGTVDYCKYPDAKCESVTVPVELPQCANIPKPIIPFPSGPDSCFVGQKGKGTVICNTKPDGTCFRVTACLQEPISPALKAALEAGPGIPSDLIKSVKSVETNK